MFRRGLWNVFFVGMVVIECLGPSGSPQADLQSIPFLYLKVLEGQKGRGDA